VEVSPKLRSGITRTMRGGQEKFGKRRRASNSHPTRERREDRAADATANLYCVRPDHKSVIRSSLDAGESRAQSGKKYLPCSVRRDSNQMTDDSRGVLRGDGKFALRTRIRTLRWAQAYPIGRRSLPLLRASGRTD
jgi:hypothetical protein